jgi:Ferritin-like
MIDVQNTLDTRTELIYALNEAAELEQGFMIQYLFYGLTIKKRLDERITGKQQELIRRWEYQILSVAREEMAHLGMVCNLLSAIGGAPHFERPNFPQKAVDYYPFDFILSPFSEETLYRFIRFELPKDEILPDPPISSSKSKLLELFPLAPDPIEYDYLSELYNQIRFGFNHIKEDELFIGPKSGQDYEYWSTRVQILNVKNCENANTVIDLIIDNGEGSPKKRDGSHYDTFLNIYKELRLEMQIQSDFDPSRPVVLNPRTREHHRDAHMDGTFIKNELSRKVAELFNLCYETSLLMLSQLYSFGGESLSERDILRKSSRHLMTMAIRPIAEILTDMPISNNRNDGNAGPPFELFGNLQLSTQKSNRWIILNEHLDSIILGTKELSDINRRFAFISENITLIQNNINERLSSEERL